MLYARAVQIQAFLILGLLILLILNKLEIQFFLLIYLYKYITNCSGLWVSDYCTSFEKNAYYPHTN